jgi:hypothetical protein
VGNGCRNRRKADCVTWGIVEARVGFERCDGAGHKDLSIS